LQSDYYQYGNVARRGRGGGLENKDCGGTANTVDTVGAYFSLRKGRARRGEARKGTKGRRSPRMNANSIQSVCRTLKSERNSRSFVYLRTQLRRTPFYFHTDVASLAGTWKQQHNIKLRNGQQSNRRCFCGAHTSCPACSGAVRAAGEGDNMIREIAILFSMLRRLRCRRAARKCIGFTAPFASLFFLFRLSGSRSSPCFSLSAARAIFERESRMKIETKLYQKSQ